MIVPALCKMDLSRVLYVIFTQVFLLAWALDEVPRECPEIVKEEGYHAAVNDGTCYMFVDREVFWKEASEFCQSMGGDLVTIKNAKTMQFLKNQIMSDGLGWSNNGVWIGLRHYDDSGWVWVTGDKLGYSNWAKDEPSRLLGLFKLEKCALMRREDDWRWHDYHCGTLKFHYHFICQFPTVAMTTLRQEPSFRIVKQIDLRPSNHQILKAMAYSYAEKGQSAHTAAGGEESNGNMPILLIVIGLAVLIIFTMLVIFFLYRKRQRDKHSTENVVVRFENRGYGPVNQNQADHLARLNPGGETSRPVSNVYMSPEEVNTMYEEVQKDFDHGNNTYLKATNCLTSPPPPPPPRSDSMSVTSSLGEGAVGGVAIEDDVSLSDESQIGEPLIGATAALPRKDSDQKGGNLYVDMSGGSKSSLESTSKTSGLDMGDRSNPDIKSKSNLELDPLEKEKKQNLLNEHTYTNTIELKSDNQNHYEELPQKR